MPNAQCRRNDFNPDGTVSFPAFIFASIRPFFGGGVSLATPTSAVELRQRMSDPNVSVNCPRCGQRLVYRKTGIGRRLRSPIQGDQEVHLYFCETDGFYSLWSDGYLRYIPSSVRQTEASDFE